MIFCFTPKLCTASHTSTHKCTHTHAHTPTHTCMHIKQVLTHTHAHTHTQSFNYQINLPLLVANYCIVKLRFSNQKNNINSLHKILVIQKQNVSTHIENKKIFDVSNSAQLNIIIIISIYSSYKCVVSQQK